MPSEYSVYALKQSEEPNWLPGEDLAAVGFISCIFLLVIEINVQIHRVFQRKTGTYFWAMQLGSVGCTLDALGLLIRYFVPNSIRVWPLYTAIATVGWATYSSSQLVVLYSRLHLVQRNPKIQRGVLYMIVVALPLLIIPDWITTWSSWNPATTLRWSAAQSIIERIVQVVFSGVEISINIIYAVSILKLLRVKSSVRQRRVMWDLMYVNILAINCDILNIVLVYVNRVGISHPTQTLSYALKLRLEFIVLNQLMAVAAKGFRQETYEEKRYYRPTISFGASKESSSLKKESSDDTAAENFLGVGSSASPPPPVILKDSDFSAFLDRDESRAASNLRDDSHRRTRHHSHGPDAMRNNPPLNSQRRQTEVDAGSRPARATKHKKNGLWKNDEDEPEDQKIGLHEWERRAKPILLVPWLKESPTR